MIITIKNLQQQTFSVEFDEEKSVLELKERIFKERGPEYVVAKQKLIYAGIILDDGRTIKSYSVDEKKFIVLMLKRDVNTAAHEKPKAAAADPAKSASPSKTAAPADKPVATDMSATSTGQQEESKNSSSATPPASGGSQTTSSDRVTAAQPSSEADTQARAESNLLLGDDYNRSVQSMMEMGYSRDIVEQAMAASYNNPERAVEYLISGIPESEEDFAATAMLLSGSGREDPPPNQGGATETVAVTTREDPFEFLRNQPQFLQMRSLVSQNPDLLNAVLQQIAQTNPALLQLISENQDAFLSMLNQSEEQFNDARSSATAERRNPVSGTQTAGSVAPTQTTDRRNIAATEPTNRTTPRDSNERDIATIRLTPHDRDAIERLKALGFPEPLVLQAYFACEKNEQLAADFLVTTAFDD